MVNVDFQWMHLRTEIALVTLVFAGLLMDIFIPARFNRGRIIGNVSIAGLLLILADLVFLRQDFGSSFHNSFIHDPYARFFKAFFIATGCFVLQMIKSFEARITKGRGEFVLLILFALIGMHFLVSANEFLVFFVGLETLTISLYIITAYLKNNEKSIEAGLKFLILGSLSTALMVYGMSFLYGATGTLHFNEMAAVVASQGADTSFVFGMSLVIAALFFKLSAFPFMFWAPDVYEGAPAPITAFLAIGSKAAGLAALLKLMLILFIPARADIVIPLIQVVAVLTLLYGNLGALVQSNLKRLMAYSSIGHAGYLLMGFLTLGGWGKEALLQYLASYLFSSAAAFLVITWVSAKLEAERIKDLAGLAERSPLLGAGLLLGLSSLAGVPPLAGFFAKFYILLSLVREGYAALAILGLVTVVISLYYYLRVIKAVYVDKADETEPLKLHMSDRIALYAAMAGIVILGVYPAPLLSFIQSIFS